MRQTQSHVKMWKALIWCWKILKQYLGNCSIHGVRYLVDDRFSYLERIFWLIFCTACWIGCAIMIKDVITLYIFYPVAVTAETMYLHWETPFPAIIFCISTTSKTRSPYYSMNPGSFPSPSKPGEMIKKTEQMLLDMYDEVKIPCTQFMSYCEWNTVPFNCCDEFRELYKTGTGHCFAINSMFIKDDGKPKIKYYVNNSVKYGDLIVAIEQNSLTKSYFHKGLDTYVLNQLQIPTIMITSRVSRKPNKTTRIEFILKDIFNEEGVKNVPIERRNCRFSHEKSKNSVFNAYSKDACLVEILIKRMIEFCGCVNVYYAKPKGVPVCNGTGMLCLNQKKEQVLHFENETKLNCLLDCEGTTLDTNYLEAVPYESFGDNYTKLHFTLLSHPTVRYRRYVVNDPLDVIVSVGSALGLFMGVSILSIVEIPYWLFVRRDKIT